MPETIEFARPVLFTGSSIIAQWEGLPKSLKGIAVTNTAVGGFQTVDLLERFEELVVKHVPRMACIYCGSNDINNAIPAEVIVENVMKMRQNLALRLPKAQFVYLAIIKAPQKMDRWDQVDQVNKSLSRCGFPFIDINPIFFDIEGSPQDDYYVEDRLHLTAQAYAAMEETIFPRLEALVSV